jgi:hypothetical protein
MINYVTKLLDRAKLQFESSTISISQLNYDLIGWLVTRRLLIVIRYFDFISLNLGLVQSANLQGHAKSREMFRLLELSVTDPYWIRPETSLVIIKDQIRLFP